MPYYSKILLFGEHTVVNGGQALAMPLTNYSAEWQVSDDSAYAVQSNKDLNAFAQYLNDLAAKGDLLGQLDIERFLDALEEGLYLRSTIPLGYGVGSSGAVCAAIYERYGIMEEKEDQQTLKSIFAQMERFFHGASSGVDPLICYLNTPVLFTGKQRFEAVEIPPIETGVTLFLLDTGIKRSTGPLVAYFQERMKEDAFAKQVADELLVVNKAAIKAMLERDGEALAVAFRAISQFQYAYQLEMIPEVVRSVWQAGLESDLYHLKICGAGGGGFMLGLTRDFDRVAECLEGYKLEQLKGFSRV